MSAWARAFIAVTAGKFAHSVISFVSFQRLRLVPTGRTSVLQSVARESSRLSLCAAGPCGPAFFAVPEMCPFYCVLLRSWFPIHCSKASNVM